MSFSSNHGLIMLALKDLIKSLQPDGLHDTEVEVRGSWLFNGEPMRGVSIYDLGEQYDAGTVGTQDIGYVCGVVFASKDDNDAVLYSDMMLAWRELVRRRLTDQRLSVTITNATDPSEHVCKVIRSGESLTNPKKYPDYSISRLVVVVWLRENNP